MARYHTSSVPCVSKELEYSWPMEWCVCQPMKQLCCHGLQIKMEGFLSKKESKEAWFSESVYSHFQFGGCKMCLNVNANGWSLVTIATFSSTSAW